MSFEQMLNDNLVKAQEPKKLRIDGEFYYGYLMDRDEFIETFHKLETLIKSDDEKYWVLYEEVNPETIFCEEYYWCIPFEEINFKWDINEGWQIVSDITLDEDKEEIINYDEYICKYSKFEENLLSYLLYNQNADIDTLKLWQSFYSYIANAKEYDIMLDNKVCLIIWLENNWNAFLECILNNTFKYMNVTSIVLQSWEEFCK